MCYNTKKTKKLYSTYDQYNGYNVFLDPVDVLSVYGKSLVMFTFNLKKKRLAENPDDWLIIAYENRYDNKNKSMTFKIQRDENIVASRIPRYNNIINNNNDDNINNNTQKTEIKDNDAHKL